MGGLIADWGITAVEHKTGPAIRWHAAKTPAVIFIASPVIPTRRDLRMIRAID